MKLIASLVRTARARLHRRGRMMRRPSHRPTGMEALEPRALLSVSTWTIRGGTGADTILITRDAGEAGVIHCTIDGVDIGSRNESELRGIRILAGAGDDTVRIDLGDVANLRCLISGGAGDDLLVGGAGYDRILGGNGNDQIEGGEGANRLYGGNGNDTLTGGQSVDIICGGRGVDTLRGNGGRDRLDPGRDRLRNFIYASPEARIHRPSSIDTIFSSDTGPGGNPANPLRQIASTIEFNQWLIDAAAKHWQGLFGQEQPWWQGWFNDLPMVNNIPRALANALNSGDGTGGSQTNNQVAGVDEADLIKTDGSFIYMLQDSTLVIIDTSIADSPRIVSTTPIDGHASQLYVSGDTVTVISSVNDGFSYGPIDVTLTPTVELANLPNADVAIEGLFLHRPILWRWDPKVQVTTFSVADREHPRIVEETKLDGSLTSSRMIDGRVFVVVGNNVAWPEPQIITGPDGVPTYESAQAYRARLLTIDLATLLPEFSTDLGGDGTIDATGSLVDGISDFMPLNSDAQSVISVVMFDADDDPLGPDSTSSIIGNGGNVFATATSLYIAADCWTTPALGTDWGHARTDIYKFDLSPAGASFAAAGSVDGNIRNSFSMDEAADGSFRIATTEWSQGSMSSTLSILQQNGQSLDTLGQLADIAPSETIQAVRFVGDTAYIVTFRQVDPLFVIDLSNPATPTILGELTIPGFSSYLHPLDATHLIGFGRAPSPVTSWLSALELSLFDVTDPSNPTRSDQLPLGGADYNYSEVEWDHHAFSHFADQGVIAVPVTSGYWGDITTGVAVVAVDPDAGFTSLGQVTTEDTARRTLLIGGNLYVLTHTQIIVADLFDPANILATLDLPNSPHHWPPIFTL